MVETKSIGAGGGSIARLNTSGNIIEVGPTQRGVCRDPYATEGALSPR